MWRSFSWFSNCIWVFFYDLTSEAGNVSFKVFWLSGLLTIKANFPDVNIRIWRQQFLVEMAYCKVICSSKFRQSSSIFLITISTITWLRWVSPYAQELYAAVCLILLTNWLPSYLVSSLTNVPPLFIKKI